MRKYRPHDLVNVTEGNAVVYADKSLNKWYNWYRFPLVPIYGYTPADAWNAADISFQWLNFSVWSVMSPDLGIEVKLEDTGLYLKVYVPYLIILINLFYFPLSWNQRLWRKGKGRSEGDYVNPKYPDDYEYQPDAK